MTAAPYHAEVIVTRRERELPPPFVCAICCREVSADPWRVRDHTPPICRMCSIHGGHQGRIPGMTRGDHHVLQRLVAVTDALLGAANLEAYYGRFSAK